MGALSTGLKRTKPKERSLNLKESGDGREGGREGTFVSQSFWENVKEDLRIRTLSLSVIK
jgi:hypothetical protein